MLTKGQYSFLGQNPDDDIDDLADEQGNLLPTDMDMDLVQAHTTCELRDQGLALIRENPDGTVALGQPPVPTEA